MNWCVNVLFIFLTVFSGCHCDYFIDNFEESGDVSTWRELSDTTMKEGRSKASVVSQQTFFFKRAVMFTMLNPQSCGAALAGINKKVHLDITQYRKISLKCRGQGQYNNYEIFLRHKGQTGGDLPAFVHFFEAPSNFTIISLEISNFRPYLMGKLVPDAEPLDRTQLTSLGILAYGGAHKSQKQRALQV